MGQVLLLSELRLALSLDGELRQVWSWHVAALMIYFTFIQMPTLGVYLNGVNRGTCCGG